MLLGNPKIRHIPVAKPDNLAQRTFVPSLVRALPGGSTADEEARRKAESEFVDETEGLLLADLQAISQLARSESLAFDRIPDAVRRYKVGVTDDPWRKIDRQKIRDAGGYIRGRVKGQDHAVVHTLDIINERSPASGPASAGGRPRGVRLPGGSDRGR